jgi:hypothetical protein
MAKLLYSIIEVQEMLATPKWMGPEEWCRGVENVPAVRDAPDERAIKLVAMPDDSASPTAFVIECRHNYRNGAFSLTLHGRIKPRGFQALCRYDLQANAHPNQSFCQGPEEVTEGEPHRHVYNEEALHRLGRWDACAELLKIDRNLPRKELLDQMRHAFCDFVHLRIVDRLVRDEFFGFGQS